jgi:hypothetical protein
VPSLPTSIAYKRAPRTPSRVHRTLPPPPLAPPSFRSPWSSPLRPLPPQTDCTISFLVLHCSSPAQLFPSPDAGAPPPPLTSGRRFGLPWAAHLRSPRAPPRPPIGSLGFPHALPPLSPHRRRPRGRNFGRTRAPTAGHGCWTRLQRLSSFQGVIC